MSADHGWGKIILGEPHVKLTVKGEALTEVRDPETGELVDHIWAPDDHEIDFSSCKISIRLIPFPDE